MARSSTVEGCGRSKNCVLSCSYKENALALNYGKLSLDDYKTGGGHIC